MRTAEKSDALSIPVTTKVVAVVQAAVTEKLRWALVTMSVPLHSVVLAEGRMVSHCQVVLPLVTMLQTPHWVPQS